MLRIIEDVDDDWRLLDDRDPRQLVGANGRNRDALRAPQTHPAPRSSQAKRPLGARDEFLLAAMAQNLRKLAKLIPIPALQPA
jgi:hypothetical protein